MSRKVIEEGLNKFYTQGMENIKAGHKMLRDKLAEQTPAERANRISGEQVDQMEEFAVNNCRKNFLVDSDWKNEIIESVISEPNEELLRSYKSVIAYADSMGTDEKERFTELVVIMEFESRLLEAGFINERP